MTGVGDTGPVVCRECDTLRSGGRSAARRAGWEPYSTASQWALDHGPMVCRACVGRLLDQLVDALRKVPAEAWDAELAPFND